MGWEKRLVPARLVRARREAPDCCTDRSTLAWRAGFSQAMRTAFSSFLASGRSVGSFLFFCFAYFELGYRIGSADSEEVYAIRRQVLD